MLLSCAKRSTAFLGDPVRRWLHGAACGKGVGGAAVVPSLASHTQHHHHHHHHHHHLRVAPVLSRSASQSASDKVPVTRDAALAKIAEIQGSIYPNFVGGADLRMASDVRAEYAHLEAKEHNETDTIRIAGRIKARRDASKKLTFFDVRFPEGEFDSINKMLKNNDVVEVVGHPGKSNSGEMSVFARQMTLLSPCLHDVPDLITSVETRVRQRHLEMLANKQLPNTLRTRAKTIRFIRAFLDQRNFVEVETPVLSPKVGGAAAHPFATECNALDGAELYMRISPELHLKQLVIGGLDRVYEIGKQFRNEGIDGTHNPEFTTVEFYQSYADFEELVATTEQMLSELVVDVAGAPTVTVAAAVKSAADSGSDSNNADNNADGGMTGALKEQGEQDIEDEEGEEEMMAIDFTPPFKRLSIVPALEEALGCSLPALDDDSEECIATLRELCTSEGIEDRPPYTVPVLVDRLVGALVEPQCVQPTFLCDHPVAMSPLAKEHPTKPGCTARFELFVNGAELCNAYQELNDPEVQRERFRAQLRDRDRGDSEATVPDEAFCDALEYGLPPTVGFGLGVDRLVMLLTNAKHIRDVIAFPTRKGD
eukprot:gene7801-6854_t